MIGNCTYCNTEITHFYLTKWTPATITFYSGDNLISGFTGLTDNWNEIVLNTAFVTYQQNLNSPGPNGLTYNEQITITLPHADAGKWSDLISLLTDRYTIVFKDANGNYYCMGYRSGTKVINYQLRENEYELGFLLQNSLNLLTSISSTYVNSDIL